MGTQTFTCYNGTSLELLLVLCAIPLSLKFHSSAVNVSMFKTIYIKNVNRVIFFFFSLQYFSLILLSGL